MKVNAYILNGNLFVKLSPLHFSDAPVSYWAVSTQMKMRNLLYKALALYVFADLSGSDARQTFFSRCLFNALHCIANV